jgi:hypothetical protein
MPRINLQKVLDQIFWKRFADELRSDPDDPAMACFAGMFQGGLILYVATIALLAPVSRLAMICLNLMSDEPASLLGSRDRWYAIIAVAAGILTIVVVTKRYWHYRLTPQVAPQMGDEVDRWMMVFTSAGLLVVAFGLMALMFALFW